jgi:addiction module HigA family antidote
VPVIRSFKDKRTEQLYRGETPGAFRAIEAVALRKLDMLDAALGFRTSAHRPATDSRRSEVIAEDNTAFGSTINGASALSGGTAAPSWSRLSIIIEDQAMTRIRTPPGEVLREEFMKPLDLSGNALALALRVPATRIGDILRTEKPRAVTADTAIRLARYFGTTAEFWLNLQSAYELSLAAAENGAAIEREVQPREEAVT